MESDPPAQPSTDGRIPGESIGGISDIARGMAGAEALERMASRVAHEFNNVLTSITGLGSLVERDLESGIVRAANIRGILDAARRANSLTSDLLAFSRSASRDGCSQSRGVVDLTTFLHRSQEEWRTRLSGGIALEIVAGTAPVPVQASEYAIGQILGRILENSRTFLDGGGEVRIELGRGEREPSFCAERGLRRGDYAEIRITDNGPGMIPETAARAFEPFFSTRSDRGSRGLGLSIAQGLIRDTGGHVDLESQPGQGCTFTIYLPIAPQDSGSMNHMAGSPSRPPDEPPPAKPVSVAPLAPPSIFPPPSKRAPQSAVPPAAPDSNPKPLDSKRQGRETILVVEDEPMVRELVTRSLGYLGYNVLKACNGQEGFELASSHASEIDVIFCDIVMPRMNGPEMVQRLRDEAGLTFRVLFTTGFTENQGIMENGELRKGVQILPKPYATRDLAERIREILDAA